MPCGKDASVSRFAAFRAAAPANPLKSLPEWSTPVSTSNFPVGMIKGYITSTPVNDRKFGEGVVVDAQRG
jgi:hypothetical protein